MNCLDYTELYKLELWLMEHITTQARRVLAPDGVAVCVVTNSTFAHRERDAAGSRSERWRLPLLTDVLLAHLARRAGFVQVEIWPARDLRPRNVRVGHARESLVVASTAPLS